MTGAGIGEGPGGGCGLGSGSTGRVGSGAGPGSGPGVGMGTGPGSMPGPAGSPVRGVRIGLIFGGNGFGLGWLLGKASVQRSAVSVQKTRLLIGRESTPVRFVLQR